MMGISLDQKIQIPLACITTYRFRSVVVARASVTARPECLQVTHIWPVSGECEMLTSLEKTTQSPPAGRLPTARTCSVAPEEEQLRWATAHAEGASVREFELQSTSSSIRDFLRIAMDQAVPTLRRNLELVP